MQNRDKPKHYCGVFGVFNHPNAAELTYFGLWALQHRGEESAGMVTSGGTGTRFKYHHGMGLVRDIFRKEIERLSNKHAVGHNRYSTTGQSELRNAQPFHAEYAGAQIALAHNGNLRNTARLKEELPGTVFVSSTDSEVILRLLAQAKGSTLTDSLIRTLRRLDGSYSLMLLTEDSLIGARDPLGNRPLSIGQIDGAFVLASETCAFDLIGATFVRDVRPGEVVVINESGLTSHDAFPSHTRRGFCIFEYIYFSRPDSMVQGISVQDVRERLGRRLAVEHPVAADIVVPIPDSGVPAAIGYADELGIPLKFAFVRNHYVGRTFTAPMQLMRELSARVKLNLIGEAVRGKRVVIVDDSIVRGTTCRKRVNRLKEAGAAEVHVRISCQPHQHPCNLGIDFPERTGLIAANMSIAQICTYLNADSLGYLSLAGMLQATKQPEESLCTGCFTGQYPGLPELEHL